LAAAHVHGRHAYDLMCEVLSTWPHPVRRVMDREGLGRLLVTQKATVADPADVYRSDNAEARDWIMIGNHRTPSLCRVIDRWRAVARSGPRAAAGLGAGAGGRSRAARRPSWADYPVEFTIVKITGVDRARPAPASSSAARAAASAWVRPRRPRR